MKLKRISKYYLLRFSRIKASPQQVAYGITLGFIPCWFPTFGLGPIISAGLARMFKANILAAFAGGLLGTPLWPALFFLNYKTGSLFFPKHSQVDEISEVEYVVAANHTIESMKSCKYDHFFRYPVYSHIYDL
jgi:uncharacterized protein